MLRFGICVALLSVLSISALAQQSRPDLNAFLNKKVTSVKGLVTQARTDREVMDRYMRHYAMSKEEVLAYLSTLHAARLQEAQVFQVYSVPEEGFVKVHAEKLNKGTLVFADMTGTPVLIMKCGNPLNRGPKNPEILNEVESNTVPEEEEALKEILNEDDSTLEAGEPLLVAMEPATPEVVVLPAVETTTGGESPIPILPAVAAGGFNGLPLLLLGGLGIIRFDDGGGGPAPVPEPSTVVALALGATAIAARKRRRR